MASHTNDRPGFRPRPPTSAHNDALLLVQRVALHLVTAARTLRDTTRHERRRRHRRNRPRRLILHAKLPRDPPPGSQPGGLFPLTDSATHSPKPSTRSPRNASAHGGTGHVPGSSKDTERTATASNGQPTKSNFTPTRRRSTSSRSAPNLTVLHPGGPGRLRRRPVLPVHRPQMGNRQLRRPHPTVHHRRLATTRSRTLLNSYQRGSADQPSTTAVPTPGQATSAWTSYVPSPMVTYREDVNRKVARMYTSQNV